MRLIVISIDGLTPSALGCYGSSWCATPKIDQLASQGCLWDRCISRHAAPGQTMASWLQSQWWHAWKQHGDVELFCDDPSILGWATKQDLDQLFLCDPIDNEEQPELATEVEGTQFAQLIAAGIERLREDQPPAVLWLHSNFLSYRWDAPRWLVPDEELDEHQEPVPDDGLIDLSNSSEVIERLPSTFDQIDPPNVQLDETAHPDLIEVWMRTYACQVRLIDELIGILLASTDDPLTIALSGTCGFGLGQNGWISQSSGPMRSCHLHVPMLIGQHGPVRCPQLTSTDTFATALERLAGEPDQLVGLEEWTEIQDEFDPKIVSHAGNDEPEQVAVTTPQWFLSSQQDISGEAETQLFLKPDDAHDANDVSRIRGDVVDQLSDR